MNRDKYGEIINGLKTYETIANKLKAGKSVVIGWTDEEYTHYDILFTGGAYQEAENYLQRGLRGTDLFVSIMGISSFGFKVDTIKHSSYIAEKLNVKGEITVDKLAELINGVIAELVEA